MLSKLDGKGIRVLRIRESTMLSTLIKNGVVATPESVSESIILKTDNTRHKFIYPFISFQVLLNNSYKTNIDKTNDLFLDRIIPSLDEGAWLINKILKRDARFGKRASTLPNSERSLLFFRRKGIYLNFINYLGLDWIIFFGVFCFFVSK